MAAFRSVRGYQATSLKDISLIYVHCVSEYDFPVSVVGIGCVELICRQVHVSFIDKMSERRIALVPCFEGCSVDVKFQNIRSPALVRVVSSSDIKFFDYSDEREAAMVATILWQLEILPAPAAHAVSPTIAAEDENDQTLPPLDLDCRLQCNCFPTSCTSYLCLSKFAVHEEQNSNEDEKSELDSLADLLFEEEETMSNDYQDEEESDEVVLHSEYFKIKGSMWEEQYQKALEVLSRKRVASELMSFRITAEPDNLRDKNAHKFEILDVDEWKILGYCGVEKLPKLVKAIHNRQIVDVKMGSLIRRYIPKILSFRFEGGLNIVKKGVWDRNDVNNRYNSDLRLV